MRGLTFVSHKAIVCKSAHMKKQFQYVFIKGSCPDCNGDLVEDFSTTDGISLWRSGCHCPTCHKKLNIVVTEDSIWQRVFEEGAMHILFSEEKSFIRAVTDDELIKKHDVEAHWLFIGRKVYIEPARLYDDETKDFVKENQSTDKTLVYLPNSHLQRLYFYVPSDAIR